VRLFWACILKKDSPEGGACHCDTRIQKAPFALPLLGERAGVRVDVISKFIALAQRHFGLFNREDNFSFAFDKSTGLAGSAAGAGVAGVGASVGLVRAASFA